MGGHVWRRIACGAAAGIAGTVAISALSAFEARLRGGPAVYEPGTMAARLAGRLGLALEDRERRVAGTLMRWPYGAAWGAALGAFGPPPSWPPAGAALGSLVLGFELVALPLIGATPGLRRWGGEQVASDALNALAYGLVTAAVAHTLDARAPRGG